MSYEYEYAVFIGRFQPFHNGHLEIIETALKKAKTVIVAIGSCRASRNIKNPWTYQERMHMISNSVQDENRLRFIPLRDYFYNDQLWLSELHQKVREITDGSDSVALIGQYSDKSSFYLNMFPQWDFIPANTDHKTHATGIRKLFFEGDSAWHAQVPL